LRPNWGSVGRSDGIAVVCTSDLGRAVQTASIAFGGSDIPVVQDRRVRECNFGRLNGCPRAQLERYGPTGVDEPYPEGERWREAITRVIDFLDEVVRSRDGERILVIGHMSAWYALECASKHVAIERALDRRMTWQLGWEYTLSRPLSTPSATVRACSCRPDERR
jgi:broad specificity phosphatase PhoE